MRWWILMKDEHLNVGELREARVRKEARTQEMER